MYGDKLIQSLNLTTPKVALDIGFGSGNLLHAAKRRWNDLSLVGIDIDNKNIAHAQSQKLIEAIKFNGFDPSLPDIINQRFGDIDLLIGNPPYYSRELDSNAKTILNSIGLLDCISKHIKKIPAELIFLAQNLRLLSKTGELGIIVPAGLISGEKWILVREFLFSNYHVSNVIQLPTNSFKRTDAQTFILIIKQKSDSYENTSLSHANESNVLNIKLKDAIVRADYDYYTEASKVITSKCINLTDFDIYRGNKSHNYLARTSDIHLHTTNMPDNFAKRSFANAPLKEAKNTELGDILIARVGRRCLGRIVYVEGGCIPISDCIIGIRPKTKNIGKAIFKKLSSSDCRNYLHHVSLGVGAKYITYKTIIDYLANNDYVST